MNILELKNLLQVKNVPNELYNLDCIGRKDERFCLEKIDDIWVVYFTERGTRTTEVFFNSEDAACKYLIEQLIE